MEVNDAAAYPLRQGVLIWTRSARLFESARRELRRKDLRTWVHGRTEGIVLLGGWGDRNPRPPGRTLGVKRREWMVARRKQEKAGVGGINFGF